MATKHSGMRRVHARVSGKVQGVFYRLSTQEEAKRLGLVGWVRNRLDGTVELECAGESAQVDRLLNWLAVGPIHARVDKVDWHEVAEERPVETDFQVRPTV